MPLAHLHATQTASFYRPDGGVDDEGVEVPEELAAADYSLVVAVTDMTDSVKYGPNGADVLEAVKVNSLDRTTLMREKDVVELDMLDGRTNVRFVIESANTGMKKSQQSVAVRRAT